MTRLFDAHIIAAEGTFREVSDLVRYRELCAPTRSPAMSASSRTRSNAPWPWPTPVSPSGPSISPSGSGVAPSGACSPDAQRGHRAAQASDDRGRAPRVWFKGTRRRTPRADPPEPPADAPPPPSLTSRSARVRAAHSGRAWRHPCPHQVLIICWRFITSPNFP
jgi:hypothetical protein